MEKTTTNRVTKVQRYADIKALLKGEAVSFGTDINEAIAFIDKEVELINNKHNSRSKKQEQVREQNEVYIDLIRDFLAIQDNPVTCTEIRKGIPELMDYENQKVASLVRVLVSNGQVTRAVVKGKSVFTAV